MKPQINVLVLTGLVAWGATSLAQTNSPAPAGETPTKAVSVLTTITAAQPDAATNSIVADATAPKVAAVAAEETPPGDPKPAPQPTDSNSPTPTDSKDAPAPESPAGTPAGTPGADPAPA